MSAEVWVQVVPVDGGREISWGSNRVQSLADRLEDVKAAIAAGARAVADSLTGLPAAVGAGRAEGPGVPGTAQLCAVGKNRHYRPFGKNRSFFPSTGHSASSVS